MEFADLGRKVKKLRKEKGFTAEGLAERCDVATASIRHIEGGRRSLSIEMLLKLCQALCVTPDYLLSEHLPNQRLNKSTITARLGNLTPKQIGMLDELITVILEYMD